MFLELREPLAVRLDIATFWALKIFCCTRSSSPADHRDDALLSDMCKPPGDFVRDWLQQMGLQHLRVRIPDNKAGQLCTHFHQTSANAHVDDFTYENEAEGGR